MTVPIYQTDIIAIFIKIFIICVCLTLVFVLCICIYMTNKSSIISFGVESQLDITNINIRKYPDDVQNILFSVMTPNKMSSYQPLSNTKTFITDPAFFKHQDMSCQTNYIDFTSDKCEQVTKEQLILPCDVTIQTDEIQPKPPETVSICMQTDEIPQPKLPDPPETINMCVQTDITEISDEELHKELSYESTEHELTPDKYLEHMNTSETEFPIKQDSELISDVGTVSDNVANSSSSVFSRTGTTFPIEHELPDANFSFTENVVLTSDTLEVTHNKSDDQSCNFSVENLFTNTCYNKHPDKNIIISTARTGQSDVLNMYEEHSHRNIIIDNTQQVCNINLYNGQEMEQKDFYLINPSAYYVIINTTRGSFCIDSHTSHKKVFYSDKWIILDTPHNNLFPTHINNKIHSDVTLQSFGSSVCIDGLGNTCVIGNITAHESIGSVCIYSYTNNIWTLNEELMCSDNIDQSFFGSSVSIDYSGRIIAIGGSGDNNGIGACWIYHKQLEDSKWMYVKKLIGSGNIGKSHQGITVHLTPDGKKVFVCGVGYDNYSGAVWVFDYNDNNWIESQKIIVPNSKRFGTSIATDHTGLQVVIGSSDNIYVFNYKEKYELMTSLFKSDTVKCININQNCSSIIATILQHIKTLDVDVYILEHDIKNNWYASHKLFEECSIKFTELYSCNSSVNGETINVCGIDENNHSVSWCFIKINDKWTMINKHLLVETITHEIVSAISAFGHATIIGLPQIENYNGECIILS